MKQITTSVGFQDAKGTVVANGMLMLTLSQTATITATGGQVTTEPIFLNLDANGKISPTNIVFNDELSPSGTIYYGVVYAANKVRMIPGLDKLQYSITGASFDIATALQSGPASPSFAGAVMLTPSGNQTITTGNLTLTGDFLPSANAARSIGGTSLGWKDIIAAGTPWYDVRAYGLVGDGVTDNVTAFNTMLTALATQAGNPLAYFPKGEYFFNSKPNSIPNNVSLIGPYTPGSAFPFGAALVANYTESTATNGFLTWDGTNAATLGTGGGVQGLLLWKATGKTGGSAIARTGTTTTVRAGRGMFRDVRISGDGTWNKGIYIDGSAITNAGSQGLRDDTFYNVQVFNTTDTNQSIHVINGVHLMFTGVLINTGAGSNIGMTITGASGSTSMSQQIYMANCEIGGNLALDFVNNLVAASTNITGTLSSTVNTTASVFNGTAGTYSPTNGLAIFGYDGVAAASQNASLVNTLRATGALVAGAAYPSNIGTGDVVAANAATGGNAKLGSDGQMIMRRNNGSGSGSNLAITFDGFTTTPYNFDTTNGFSTTNPITEKTANAAQWIHGQASELLTLSTIGTTTDTSGNLLPANSIIEAVVARVTTTITVATDWKLGDATISGRFSTADSTMTAGETVVGTVQADQTGTSGPRQAAAAKVRVTTTGTPGAGVIRITVFYRQFVAPTS